MEYNSELIKKLKLEIDLLISDTEEVSNEKIFEHEKNMLRMDTPKIWNVHEKGNMEVKMEVEFEQLLFALGERTNEDLTEIVVFRFMSLIQYLKSKKDK